MSKILIAIVVLFLLSCGNHGQIVRMDKEKKCESDTLYAYTKEVRASETTALVANYDKNMAADTMKNKFEVSDYGMARARYIQIFGKFYDKREIPECHLCSSEDNTKRLQNAIEIYGSYQSYVHEYETSELGMALLRYESWFRRPLPECTFCNESKRLEHIKTALEFDLIYPTEEENDEIEKMLIIENQKKWKRALTDFELKTIRVHVTYSFDRIFGNELSITRTATGAIAKIYQSPHRAQGQPIIEKELKMSEWLSLVKQLRINQVTDWNVWKDSIYNLNEIRREDFDTEEAYDDALKYYNYERYFEDCRWSITIYFLNKNELCVGDIDKFRFHGCRLHGYPPNWESIKLLMNNMVIKITFGLKNIRFLR